MNEIKCIVQIADVHIKKTDRYIEYRAIFDNLYAKLHSIKPDRIVLCGDIYDKYNDVSPEATDLMGEFFRILASLTEKLIIIPGNHDIVSKITKKMDALTPIINNLNINNIIYYEDSNVYEDENIAWVHYSIKDNYRIPETLLSEKYNNKLKIGLFHGKITGSTNDAGYKFDGVNLDIFNGCDVVLCGDIHKRQTLKTKNGIDVIYSGSLIQQDYSETISKHGYNVIELDSNNIQYNSYDIENPQKMLHFVIEDFEDLNNNEEKLVNV